ncbi:MAG: XdhC family protein [Saprospiraceae bacterium]|nr:XdhC family protein [Saprospiraceae bacterium]MDP5049937.1 XdhC family protein [Saprospiraceae bacterium]
MKEIREIINAYNKARKNKKRLALATLVHLNGSSYRRPGARMIVDEEGQLTGAISGGCLEGDALRKAVFCIHTQIPKLVVYDTSDEEDATIGIQLGCSGIIQVLFEPIDENDPLNPIELLKKAIHKRQNTVLVTLYAPQIKKGDTVGTSLLLEDSGEFHNNSSFQFVPETLLLDIKETLTVKKSSFKSYQHNDNTFNAFLSFISPPISLVIVGAGNDAIPLQSIAETLGWEVTIVDGRHTYAKIERFSSACQIIVSKPEKVLQQIPIDEKTVFVLMTHNYNYDYAILKALLGKNIPYIGALGPKKKLDNMITDLKAENIFLNEKQKNILYGPVGLELGAETPAEIALSITAEIMSVMNNKKGGSLRNLLTEIHPRYFSNE